MFTILRIENFDTSTESISFHHKLRFGSTIETSENNNSARALNEYVCEKILVATNTR